MIRKGNLFVTLALAGAIAVFCLVFMDPLLKCVIIRVGEKIAGAKVELASLKTEIFKGKIILRDFAVADKEDPFKNLAEFQEARFAISPAALLEKKVVIQEASLKGLTGQTPRKTSGQLPQKRKKAKEPEKEASTALQQKIEEKMAQTKNLGLQKLEEAKGAGQAKLEAVKPENLSSLKFLKEGEDKLTNLMEPLKKDIAAQQDSIKTATQKIKQDLEAIKTTDTKDLRQVAEKAKKIKEIQKNIKELEKGLDETKDRAGKDFKEVKNLIDQAQAAKAKDLQALATLMGLPSLDAENIALMLLGPKVSQHLNKAMSLMELAKKNLPAKSTPPPSKLPKRGRGVNIVFPKKNVYPTFLWKHTDLSGTAPMAEPLDFAGELKDVAYLPSQWAKPLAAHINGKRRAQELNLDLTMDHRKEDSLDQLRIRMKAVPISNLELGQGNELGLAIQKGLADIDFTLLRKNEFWDGKATVLVSSAKLDPQIKISGAIGEKLKEAIRTIQNFKILVGLKGEAEHLDFSLQSDLGRRLSDALKGMLTAEINKQKKALEDKVNALYQAKAASLEGSLQNKYAQVLAPLDGQKGEIKKLLEQALGASKSDGAPGASGQDKAKDIEKKLKNLFKK